MDIIICDHNRIEKGVLSDFSINFDSTESMDFEMKLPLHKDKDIGEFYWYIPETEYGGISDGIGVETDTGELSYNGRNWRGILSSKIIVPPSGQDYKIVSGNLSDIVQELLVEAGLNDLFVSGKSRKNITSFQFERYTDLYSGLVKLGNVCGQALSFASKTEKSGDECRLGKIELTYVDRMDYSSEVEYTGYDVNFKIHKGYHSVNHLICLGQGELKDRTVVHLYVDGSGNISDTQFYFGLNEWSETYENTSAASEDELRQGGIARLKELMNDDSVEVTAPDIDLKVGDIIGGYEEITGISVKCEIVNIIADIDDDGINLSYKVGEKLSASRKTSGSQTGDYQVIVVDEELDENSKNPVENKAIVSRLKSQDNTISDLSNQVSYFSGSLSQVSNQVNTQGRNIVDLANYNELQDIRISELEEHNSEQDEAIAEAIDVHYGETDPAASLGKNKDFYLKRLFFKENVLTSDGWDCTQDSSHPITVTDFVTNSKNNFDFVIAGNPSNYGAGETLWFDLNGLEDGNTYTLTFNLKFNDGATFGEHGNDQIIIGSSTIALQSNSDYNSYSTTFTYTDGDTLRFQFYSIRAGVDFTATITNLIIESSSSKGIDEIWNKDGENWLKYIPPESGGGSDVSITPTLLTGEKIADYMVDGVAGELFAPQGGSTGLILDAVKYSTDEQVIGVWTDGKPLYQITVISTTVPTSNAWTQVNLPSDISVKKYDAYYYRNGSNVDKFSLADNSNEKLVAVIRGTVLSYWVSSGYVNDFQNITITLQYTKTADTAGSGGYQAYGFSPIIYSEEEREVGVWTDGKPLYQKTYELQSEIIVTNTWDWTSLGISAGDIEIYAFAVAQNNSGTCWAVNCATINGNIAMSTGRNQDTIGVKKFTIQYTKTTDVAGSGSYNTLGVPTVHYSTDDEQVIGTWIDGKPLYQKTIYGIPFTSNEQVAYPLNIHTENCWFDFTMSYIYGSWGHRQPWYSFDVFEANGILYFQTPHPSGSLCAVIKYTKTTD